MQGIYTYIPETNHIPREHRVAAILVLLFMVPISLVPALTPLYLYVNIIIIIIFTYLLIYYLLILLTSLITYPPIHLPTTYLLTAIEFSPCGSTDKQIIKYTQMNTVQNMVNKSTYITKTPTQHPYITKQPIPPLSLAEKC
jgi:hypothetical protein